MARNGKEALAILKETNVDLVVSDIMMPEMDETMAISPKDKEFIERLDTEIQKNLQEPTFSIDTLAEIMCMSRSNFYRKIKGISGMSPNDYLKTIRLKMAAELLLQQEYRINEIYELVGFSSSSYFTKCFKEQFGVPPKEFLNNAKNNAGNKSSEIVT